MADMEKKPEVVQDPKHPEGLDEPLRAANFDEKEEFDAEWRSQAPDAKTWVEYSPIPGLDYREISIKDWEKAGVGPAQNPGYLRWDKGNDWRIPRGMLDFLTDGQFHMYIERDGRFKVVDR